MKKSEIHPSIAPDHFAIYLLLSWTSETPRGPGLWKFNNTLLGDTDYVTKIHETYSRARAFYSDLEDKRLLWEMLKMEMRATTISFSKNKAKLTNTKESQIKAQLEELDWLICNNFNSPDIDNVLKEYENLKMELQSIYDQKGKAAIFRSKCRWVHNKKTIRELRIEDDSTTNNDEKILEAIERYYKTLYTCTTDTVHMNTI